MSIELASKRDVLVNYGTRVTGRAAGIVKTEGANNELVIDLTGQILTDLIVFPVVVPSGSIFTGEARLVVSEAFNLAVGTVVEVGQQGSEVTNGVSLTEAELESTGTKDVSAGLAGEWAITSELSTDHTIDIALSAGSVTSSTVGKAQLILEYIKLA
ncbi:MAG: hypothetical protein JKY53_14785 [Flavobacteriales bacterium]|nr:hypothetical protein [Flavobacteriales bacterium]